MAKVVGCSIHVLFKKQSRLVIAPFDDVLRRAEKMALKTKDVAIDERLYTGVDYDFLADARFIYCNGDLLNGFTSIH